MTPSTDWQEDIAADEGERFLRHAQALRELQRRHATNGKAQRGLHAKPNAGLLAEFTVLPDLPPHAQVGIFAQPGTFRAYARFSNGSGHRQSDRKGDVRGIALKVLGVGGRKLIPGLEDAKTQDFLLIRSSAVPFRHADEFVALVLAAENPALLLPRLVMALGLRRTMQILPKMIKGMGEPMRPLAKTRYFSALPVRWGQHAARYALTPHDDPQGTAPPAQAKTAEHLREELAQRLRQGPVTYDFRVQFYCDAARTPIEDASVDWLETDAPYVTVARVVLPQQDVADERGQRLSEFVEGLSFDPWHAPVEFRPLGNVMRARNLAYRESTQERGAAGEPDGEEVFA